MRYPNNNTYNDNAGVRYFSTSGSSFLMYVDQDIRPVYRREYQVRVCAYCHEQKEGLSCPGCGARRDLEQALQ